MCDILSENKDTNLFTGKFTGIFQKVHWDLMGNTGSLPEKLEIYQDMSFLGNSSPLN